MKARTAWDVTSRRHDLSGKVSYETFKRFVRERSLGESKLVAVPRIETEPGAEVQIDYGKAGMKLVGSRRRAIKHPSLAEQSWTGSFPEP